MDLAGINTTLFPQPAGTPSPYSALFGRWEDRRGAQASTAHRTLVAYHDTNSPLGKTWPTTASSLPWGAVRRVQRASQHAVSIEIVVYADHSALVVWHDNPACNIAALLPMPLSVASDHDTAALCADLDRLDHLRLHLPLTGTDLGDPDALTLCAPGYFQSSDPSLAYPSWLPHTYVSKSLRAALRAWLERVGALAWLCAPQARMADLRLRWTGGAPDSYSLVMTLVVGQKPYRILGAPLDALVRAGLPAPPDLRAISVVPATGRPTQPVVGACLVRPPSAHARMEALAQWRGLPALVRPLEPI